MHTAGSSNDKVTQYMTHSSHIILLLLCSGRKKPGLQMWTHNQVNLEQTFCQYSQPWTMYKQEGNKQFIISRLHHFVIRVHKLGDPSIKLIYQRWLEQSFIHSPCSL